MLISIMAAMVFLARRLIARISSRRRQRAEREQEAKVEDRGTRDRQKAIVKQVRRRVPEAQVLLGMIREVGQLRATRRT